MNNNSYKHLMEDSPIGYAYHKIICNVEGIPCEYEFIEGNLAFEKITGLIRSDILGRKVSGIIPGRSRSKFKWVELYGDIEINEDKKEFEHFSKPLKKWYRGIVYSPKKNYMITYFIDISREKGQLDELKNLEEEKADRAAELVIANKELAYQDEEKEDRAAELVIANKELAFQSEEKEDRAAELVIANKELIHQNEEKEKRAAELLIANTDLGELLEVTHQLEAANETLQQLSFGDGLTGVANRRHFDKELAEELSRAKRENTSLSLLMFDIDFFKLYNDTNGHFQGDDCLRMVALTAQKALNRPGDCLARYGGDEFSVILPNTNLAGAFAIAEQIREAIENSQIPHVASKCKDTVTISVGVGSFKPVDDILSSDLIKMADHALYHAKETGRNRVSTFGDLKTKKIVRR